MFKMIKKHVNPGTIPKAVDESEDELNTAGEQHFEKPKIKKRKRHNSALAAAAQAGSVVDAANARSSGDAGYSTTGTNLTYKEDGGVL